MIQVHRQFSNHKDYHNFLYRFIALLIILLRINNKWFDLKLNGNSF